MLSVVIPVFRNQPSLRELVARLEALNGSLPSGLEAVFVVDGSPDQSYAVLAETLPTVSFDAQLLALSRNFGSFWAIRTGLAHGRGEHFAVMAADLQEPPELLLDFERHLSAGDCDVVVGVRTGREDPWPTRLMSRGFWSLYRRFVQSEIPPGGVDVFACTGRVRDLLVALEERNTSLVGLLFWLGFRRHEVPYTRLRRVHGQSAWSVARRFRYLLDSFFSFSDLPVRVLSLVGFLGIACSVLGALLVLTAKLTGRIEVPGYSATILTIVFFGALNSLGLGVVGEYVWRTFENSKGRPGSIVAAHERYPKGRSAA